ncbi:hypothetical protein NUW54_g8997 [Trametes sanguinea]|uniref:Uncharacterized protein n=1 Tax=Trametes sanguinea TaxID=158606 RepID=A0ACC1PBY8_9APHY|nr:hypothetical protein NUW54_g8997 [Trametes sanguinea]
MGDGLRRYGEGAGDVVEERDSVRPMDGGDGDGDGERNRAPRGGSLSRSSPDVRSGYSGLLCDGAIEEDATDDAAEDAVRRAGGPRCTPPAPSFGSTGAGRPASAAAEAVDVEGPAGPALFSGSTVRMFFWLYMEQDFALELEEQMYPEILRTNLANTVLELAKLGIDDLVHFDYLDAPAPETLMRALGLLNYLAVLDDDGKYMAKMLIVNPEFNCSHEILTIVAMLSVPSVWLRPQSQRREADSAKAMLMVPDGDHLTLMNLYNQYVSSMWSPAPQSECIRLTKTTSRIVDQHDKNWCWNNYLSARALQQAENVRTQLLRIMERNEIDLVTTDDERKLFQNIRKALVCGFFMQVAHKEGEKNAYLMVKDNQVVSLHPSCGLDTSPEWVVFNEFVIISKT